jgi:thiol-disulfide isomerase/thioredoxin
MPSERYTATVNAPQFPPELEWLNTDHPLTLGELRGKLVLLDFWTFSCINCLHVLAGLQKLERKHSGRLVVIGVHSPKFTGERPTPALHAALLRLAVGHPVVNDHASRLWREYTVRAWPTLIFLDPHGKIVGKHEGEFDLEQMDALIAHMLAEFESRGSLDPRELSFTSTRENESHRQLRFPGKVLADGPGGRLFVADTGHHRILELSLDSRRACRIYGDGEPGLQDGESGAARFQGPQGLALAGESLYVADTDNHAVRRIDLVSGRVETVAGTGEQSRPFHRGGPARSVALNSPWDLAVHGDRLFVAMAGFHQVWLLDAALATIVPWAGSGREGLVDGPRTSAMFAQPSGLALDAAANLLYVADSEASAVRVIEMERGGDVRTVVGRGLFEFGDVDGYGPEVRLQHPLSAALDDGKLLVADSYNHKIKKLELPFERCETYAGTGLPGHQDGPAVQAQFSEPGGVSIANGKLYVADTNNHAIRAVDLDSSDVSTLAIKL